MLSKEEIEEILEQNENIITYKADKDFRCLTNSERTLLENNKKIKKHIEELEKINSKLNKMIDKMVEYLAQDIRCIRPEIECNKMTHDCRYCVKQHFKKKAEEN